METILKMILRVSDSYLQLSAKMIIDSVTEIADFEEVIKTQPADHYSTN